MTRTLVVIIGSIRAHNSTFNSFKANVIDTLNADLCLCVGVDNSYDYDNPFHKLAKYHFYTQEPNDYATLFDDAFQIECSKHGHYDKFHNKIPTDFLTQAAPRTTNHYATYLGELSSFNAADIDTSNGNLIVTISDDAPDQHLRNQVFSVIKPHTNLTPYDGSTTFLKRIHWRQFIQIKDQWLGPIKDRYYKHPGTAGLLIYYRWALQQKLISEGLLEQYDRFVITRADYIYNMPLPSTTLMSPEYIWIPDGEQYHGFTDRFAMLSRDNVIAYTNILTNLVINSHSYFFTLSRWQRANRKRIGVNLEQTVFINLALQRELPSVRYFPYVMYTVREPGGQTTWSHGTLDHSSGLYIKYASEKNSADHHLKAFKQSGLSLDEYYRRTISRPRFERLCIPLF